MYFGLPATRIPALTCAASRLALRTFECSSGWPDDVQKTRLRSLFVPASFHSLSVLATIVPKGTVRSPAADFGLPIALNLSAR